MSEKWNSLEEYGGQLGRWVSAFAQGRYQDLEEDLEDTCTTNDVRRFLVNSFGNRYAFLMREMAVLAGAFEDLSTLIEKYIRTVPQARFDVAGPGDEELFLVWLTRTQELAPLQSDFVTCQRGEYAVGTEARRNRPGHLRFQQIWRRAGERAAGLGVDPGLRIHLNPIRVAGELRTSAFATEEQQPPIDVLFYAAGSRVRALPLENGTVEAIRTLAERGPCTLDDWTAGSGQEQTRLIWLAGELSGVGLVAFA
jgi:hypothetical protein